MVSLQWVRGISGLGMLDFGSDLLLHKRRKEGYNRSARGFEVSHCVSQGSVEVLHGCIEFKDWSDYGCRASFCYVYAFKDACVVLAPGSWWVRNLLWLLVHFGNARDLDRGALSHSSCVRI